MKIASVGVCVWFPNYVLIYIPYASVTHRHSFSIIQLHYWQKLYFLKRSLSSITPSEVVWRVSLNISMHSFNRGSDVRNPVDLSACHNKTIITKMKQMGYNKKVSTAQLFINIRDICYRIINTETFRHLIDPFACIWCQRINVIWNPQWPNYFLHKCKYYPALPQMLSSIPFCTANNGITTLLIT